MSQTNANNSQIAILNTIHKVEGFDPTPLAVEYVDLTTQEKRKRLPVMAQLAWFRLRYSVEIVNDRGTYYDQLQYTYHPCGRGAPLTEYYYFFGFALIAIIVAAQALMGV